MAVKATYEPSLQSHPCLVVGKHALFKLNIDCSDATIRIRHHIGSEGDCQEKSWREPWRESDKAHELCQSAWVAIQAVLCCHIRLSYTPIDLRRASRCVHEDQDEPPDSTGLDHPGIIPLFMSVKNWTRAVVATARWSHVYEAIINLNPDSHTLTTWSSLVLCMGDDCRGQLVLSREE